MTVMDETAFHNHNHNHNNHRRRHHLHQQKEHGRRIGKKVVRNIIAFCLVFQVAAVVVFAVYSSFPLSSSPSSSSKLELGESSLPSSSIDSSLNARKLLPDEQHARGTLDTREVDTTSTARLLRDDDNDNATRLPTRSTPGVVVVGKEAAIQSARGTKGPDKKALDDAAGTGDAAATAAASLLVKLAEEDEDRKGKSSIEGDSASPMASSIYRRGFHDWPPSRREVLWKSTSDETQAQILQQQQPQHAHSSSGTDDSSSPLHCPKCISFLAGAAHEKKILLIGHSLNIAGGEVFLFNLAELLEQSGALVRLLFLRRYPDPLLEWHNEAGHSYLFWKEKSSTTTATGDTGGDVGFPINFDDFDVVLPNTLAIDAWSDQNFFATMKGLITPLEYDQLMEKTLYWVHEIEPDMYLKSSAKKVLPRVKRVLFDSYAGRDKYVAALPSIANKTTVIWPGVSQKQVEDTMELDSSLTSYDKNTIRKELGINATEPDDVVFLQAATYMNKKGQAQLIVAFQSFIQSLDPVELTQRAWFLVLVGDQYDAKKVLFQARATNDYLEKMGSRSRVIPRDKTLNVVPYFKAADIFVLNSVCENFGMVIAEAMFAHLPVVARECGGPIEMVKHQKTGLLISPNKKDNLNELVSAFQNLTTGEGWRKKVSKMGNRGSRRAATEFSYVSMAKKVSNVLSSIFYFDETRKDSWRCTATMANVDSGPITTEKSFQHGSGPPYPALMNLTSYDMHCATVGNNFYFLGGYRSPDHTVKRVEKYDLIHNRWTSTSPLPENAPESHVAVASDDRYIYYLSGQLGPVCNRPVNSSFVFDSYDQVWQEIPALPVARYAACAAVLDDRLHFVGGLDIDRRTPRTEHYSMSLSELQKFLLFNGTKPLWRSEPPIPTGSGHVSCRVLDGKLYYFGGEAEDYYAEDPDSGNFNCVPGLEWNSPIVHVFDGHAWSRGPDMPYPISHFEGFSIASSSSKGVDSTFFFGGSGAHEKINGRGPIISDGILSFSSKSQEFHRIGSLYPVGLGRKGTCGTAWATTDSEGEKKLRILVVGGQATASRSVPWHGRITPFAMICDAPEASLPVDLHSLEPI